MLHMSTRRIPFAQTISTLREYYEDTVNKPLRPTFFTPILLYHSYNGSSYNGEVNEQSSVTTFQNVSNRGGNLPVLAHVQHCSSDINATSDEVEEHDNTETYNTGTYNTETYSTETLSSEICSKTQHTAMGTIEKHGSVKKANLQHCLHTEYGSLASGAQLEETSIESELIQNSNSKINENITSDDHRSAFSKPRRCHGTDSSGQFLHEINTCMDSAEKAQWNMEMFKNYLFQTDFYNFYRLPFGFQHISNSKDAQSSYLTCNSGYHNCHLSSHPERCLLESEWGAWGQHILHYNMIEMHQASLYTQAYDTVNSNIYDPQTPTTYSQFVHNYPTGLFNLKPQVDRGDDYKKLIYQISSSAATPTLNTRTTSVQVHAEKSHKCECGRAFARNEELTRHKRIHSGQRPFTCSHCGKTFGRKDHLNKHQTTHLQTSEKKLYVCEVKDCLQRYTRSDALARHQLTAHGIRARISKWRPHPHH